MRVTIVAVDHAPRELHAQTPIDVELLRQLPGEDRPDYWLGELQRPIRWIESKHERTITHVVLAARWESARIEPGAKDLAVGIAYVVDRSLLGDKTLDFSKCRYVAIGVCQATGRDTPD